MTGTRLVSSNSVCFDATFERCSLCDRGLASAALSTNRRSKAGRHSCNSAAIATQPNWGMTESNSSERFFAGGSPLISQVAHVLHLNLCKPSASWGSRFPLTSDPAVRHFADRAGRARSVAADAVPAGSYDANTHMFFASHYAQHWFNPWNEKWFGGFSQTTYPPLTHQWIALFSHIMGIEDGLHVRADARDSAAADWHVSLCRAVGG